MELVVETVAKWTFRIKFIAGVVPQSLQLQSQINLASLGWRHK